MWRQLFDDGTDSATGQFQPDPANVDLPETEPIDISDIVRATMDGSA